jgi:hypothetical protein
MTDNIITNSNINNNINSNNTNTNPNYYVDLIITTGIAQQLRFFNANNGFSIKNVSVIILLLSINEIKNLLKYSCVGIKDIFMNNYKPFFSSIYFSLKNTYYFLDKRFNNKFINNQKELEMQQPLYNCLIYNVKPKIEFMQGLINILNEKNSDMIINYDISNDKKMLST